MKKKTLLSSVIASIFVLSMCNVSVMANSQKNDASTKNMKKNCAYDCKCKQNSDKACPQDCKCGERTENPERMSPEERRAEFEKRMNLTDEQKAKLEAIKAEEQKKLEPIRNKMKKKHDEMRELIKMEADIRKSSMQKFETVLTPEQKAELERMKAEIHQQMRHEFGPKGPGFGPGMRPDAPPMGPALHERP